MPRLAVLLVLTALLTGCHTLGKSATTAIPELDTQGDVYKTLGPNDPLVYDSTVGKKQAIMVFVEFPNLIQSQTTQERAKRVLGEGTFHNIFESNSYGKLSMDIEQIHGWRRMPKENTAYDATTTEGHRDLFIDAFALYPEVDFNNYDYIMVIVTGRGNFAFGERDDKAIPHRGKKINVALNQASQNPYTLAHETGHLMGMPDLYTYTNRVPEGTAKNPAGPWDIMSGPSTGFIGWHRHKMGWLDDDRKTYLTRGTHTLTLTPLAGEDGVSLIVVPAVGEDPDKPSKVYVAEIAEPIRVKEDKQPKPGGVLVYSVDGKLPTGFNPLVVYPAPGRDLINAVFHAGEAFADEDAPFTLRVLQNNDDGSYEVQVTIQ